MGLGYGRLGSCWTAKIAFVRVYIAACILNPSVMQLAAWPALKTSGVHGVNGRPRNMIENQLICYTNGYGCAIDSVHARATTRRWPVTHDLRCDLRNAMRNPSTFSVSR